MTTARLPTPDPRQIAFLADPSSILKVLQNWERHEDVELDWVPEVSALATPKA